ncbi:MAG: flagellar hook-basal body complex protein [Pseudolabrys sp.]
MGVFGALSTAVNGLQSQSYALQNISGNIANSQTIAYKSVDTSFLNMIPDLPPDQQTAGGVKAQSRPTNTVQGTIQNAAVGTYMAISGDGYFAVKRPTGASGTTTQFAGTDLYTRRGDFALNQNGYLVNGAGYYLEGIPVNPTTGNAVGSSAAPLQLGSSFLAASATSTVTYSANLPKYPKTTKSDTTVAGSELLNPADFGTDPTIAGTGTVVGSDSATFLKESLDGGSVTAYDATGQAANVQLRWAKTANTPTATWQLFYQTNSTATGAAVGWKNVGTSFQFNSTGTLTSPATSAVALTGASVDGVSLGNLSVQLTPTQYADSTGAVTVNTLQQDGYPAGQLQSISVTKSGRIAGTFTNGKTVDLAEVPLYHFASPNNLKGLDGGAYEATGDSGVPLAGASGKIVGSSLEGSNADIADQFTKLIVTQQAYSANTKVITTANQMSQEMMNMLR